MKKIPVTSNEQSLYAELIADIDDLTEQLKLAERGIEQLQKLCNEQDKKMSHLAGELETAMNNLDGMAKAREIRRIISALREH